MPHEFYTLYTLAARLERSKVGCRQKLRPRLPAPIYGTTPGNPLLWSVDEVEAYIVADPSLVLKAKGGVQ